MPHHYTPEQKEFISENIKGRTSKELTQLVNAHFELNLENKQIRTFLKNHKLRSGINRQFQKGHVPFNKGKKGFGGWEPTQFRKGNKPHNYKPVGTERVNGDGYVDIKIADPSKWRPKHFLVWEEKNGPVPKGKCLLFLDGNKLNVSLDNLELITRTQLVMLNKNHLIQKDADLTRTGIIMADIFQKIGERKRVSKNDETNHR